MWIWPYYPLSSLHMVCPGEIFIDKYPDKFGCFFFAVISNSCKRDVVDEYICLF